MGIIKEPVYINLFTNQTSNGTSLVFRLDSDGTNNIYNLLRGGVISFAGTLGGGTLTMQKEDSSLNNSWSDTGDNAVNPFYSTGEEIIPFQPRAGNYRFVLSNAGGSTNITVQITYNID
jgi:hypothetical protein